MRAYLFLARLTVVVYAAMSVAAWSAGNRRQAAIAALFAVANAVIFEVV